ncbi:PHB depolymerase family esterase [Sphingobium sp. CAP-1]|nr:PHB depolymerase family esterase [Sphingobium sp. CAP-1]
MRASRTAWKGKPLSAALMVHKALLTVAPSAKVPRKAKVAAGPARPKPGSFIEDEFRCATGSLRYRLYTPIGSTRRRLPLLVMLHGCTQNAGDFARGTDMNGVADERGFLVLYPEQSPSHHPSRCWNWHRPANHKRGAGEAALIAALTRHVIDRCRANPDRVYIAGLSAGGAAAAIIAGLFPDLYAAVGVHSGVPLGSIRTLGQALSAMRGKAHPAKGAIVRPSPMILFHGDGDPVVHPSNATGFVDQLRQSVRGVLHSRSNRGRTVAGREFTRTRYRQAGGPVLLEEWTVHESGHAWSGGRAIGTHTDPAGPDASRAMADFFLARRRKGG